jgi:hypothetical protein
LLYPGTPRTTQQSLQKKQKPIRLPPVVERLPIRTVPVFLITTVTVSKAMKILAVANKVTIVAPEPVTVPLLVKAIPIVMAPGILKVAGIRTIPLPRPLPPQSNNGTLQIRLNFILNLA